MKRTKMLFLMLGFCITGSVFSQTQYINIATAFDQATLTPLTDWITPAYDTEWEVKEPAASMYSTAAVSASGSGSLFSNWIGFNGSKPLGTYKFRVKFTPQNVYGCTNLNIASARIVFDWTDADDELRKIYLNGTQIHDYSIMPPVPGITTSFLPGIGTGFYQPDHYSINIPIGSITPGVNTIEFDVENTWNNSPTGLNIDATIEITYSNLVSVNAGPDVTICQGACATLTATGSGTGRVTYDWSDPVGSIGSGSSITVCPTQATTYCVTKTSGLTGCSATDCITVFVEDNNPAFSYANNVSNPSYLTATATPVNLTLPPSGGYAWFIEELDAANNPLFTIQNPSVWWNFPSTPTNPFNGFDHTAVAYSGTVTSLPSTPAQGKFLYNRKYRITRCTWSPVCPWQCYQYTFMSVKSLMNSEPALIVFEDETSPELMNLFSLGANENSLSIKDFKLYPNPANNVLNLEYTLNDKASGKIQITDLAGRVLKTTILSERSIQTQIDLSNLSNGSYLVHFYEADKLITAEKIIVIK